MRILIVSNTYPPADISGVGALAQEMADQLAANGHYVRVITRQALDDDRVVGIGGPKGWFPWLAGLAFLRLSNRAPFDLIHVHESDGVFVTLFVRLARLLRRPTGRVRVLATLHVSYVREKRSVRDVRANGAVVSRPTPAELTFRRLRVPLHILAGKWICRLADAVATPSEVTAGELRADYGARVVAVIPNGVGEMQAAPRGSGDHGNPVVLYGGALRSRKALAVLLVALVELRRSFPRATLLLAGDGEQRSALERQARELGIVEAVRFLGAVPRQEMARWYGSVDIFCLPSIYEGFPVTILEAMSVGLPIVATTVAGIPEAVEEGVSGYLVEPEDARALAAALGRLAGDPALRRRMGTAASRTVRERYTIRAISARYFALFEELTG